MDVTMSPKNPVVSREEWLEARRKLLALEKEETHLRDKVRAERQAMPWVKVDKDYVFDTPKGKKSLAELFDDRSQLLVYHFMLGPDWDAGCLGCSFLSDHIDGALPHLNNHDVTYVAVARAPLDKIEAYKKRMGWKFPWVSSFGSDFNFDYHVSFTKEDLAKEKVYYNFREVPPSEAHDELPGLSAFYRNEAGEIFHTYSSYARGGEELIGTLMILDRAPLGRNEDSTMNFVKRHDEYEQKPQETASSCCH
ncbi:CalU12 protein [Neorhizobium galegae bv. officinalis bv. officinalis str. HAMBI 1141]|uniref:CalU12 protein n=1 Tax=Neorhizobium galegae bv. officinalis bv. officinalis str. HAMBI 1141 TaxID=1028801 RepID=A0A068T4Q7_NEOGA|nr:thioredoxin family protein [Neorhizobium galegae]CDN53079.1 CalU12 protein [Neorhizobium galegae bv. officinalis bv. officinalis str. HAMBI 1141]